jgi:hypothetical protein
VILLLILAGQEGAGAREDGVLKDGVGPGRRAGLHLGRVFQGLRRVGVEVHRRRRRVSLHRGLVLGVQGRERFDRFVPGAPRIWAPAELVGWDNAPIGGYRLPQ